MDKSLRLKNNEFFRQALFILLLLGTGGLIFLKLNFLLSSFLGAITLYCILRKPVLYLTEKKHWKNWVASLTFTIVTILAILAIVFGIVEIIAARIPSIDRPHLLEEVSAIIDKINEFIGFNLISKDIFTKSSGFFANLASGVLNSTYNFAINIFMTVFILYFMLANVRGFEKTLLNYIPFHGRSLNLLKTEVTKMIYSNTIGIPVIMIAQALVSALGYWIVGIDHIIFWAFLTALFGLIPLIGTAAVWVPTIIYLFAIGQIWQPIVLLLYCVIILSNTDNACRMILMKAMANIHPLIIIIGVLLGIPLFGFWGIIFGPLLVSCFLLLVRIYFMEYYHQDPEAESPNNQITR
ncbi:AI-2E family transporter [Bacteroidales bacterium OttesenSCG-928-B11]|nr:AI-2E family transporter [Bacteroidales bacterium OttesenSCG-928-E04]MDL2311249.1 AI-2E family transporter [Bacteroidales bacterium OttesenSCG-928-B11]